MNASTTPDTPSTPLVRLRTISKSFGGVPALINVDIVIRRGQILSLCGGNGAGKSTLIEVLAGSHQADDGTIEIDGRPVFLRSPADSLRRGIAVIHQEPSLVDPLSVADNIRLGIESRKGPFINRASMRKESQRLLDEFGVDLDVNAEVGGLSVGQRQLVEIVKALGRNAELLVLDEPTAALGRVEVEHLHALLIRLRSRGLAIVYVSHHLDEVLELSDEVAVLRDGRMVGRWRANQLSLDALMTAMVGEVVDIRSEIVEKTEGTEALRVVALSGKVLQGVDLSVRQGEVVGLTGLAGAGHEELARIVFGADAPASGQIFIDGKGVSFRHPRGAIRAGVASVPPDRRREGLLTGLDVERNITVNAPSHFSKFGWIQPRRRRKLAERLVADYEVDLARLSQRVTTLSGGNQQKVLMARWSVRTPKILIVNEPTRGIDVKTRERIHRRIEEFARTGVAVLLVTSDIHELKRLADRVVVFDRGRVAEKARVQDGDGRLTALEHTQDNLPKANRPPCLPLD